jgi:hypothetical protein
MATNPYFIKVFGDFGDLSLIAIDYNVAAPFFSLNIIERRFRAVRRPAKPVAQSLPLGAFGRILDENRELARAAE